MYQIGTADELVWFAKQVNGGSTAISGVLTAEIDLNGFDWTPIGSSAKKFSGSFDGAGHTIKNLTIDYQTAKSGERLYLGLFGYAEGTKDNRAAIKNLTVQGSVNAGSEFSVYSGNVAGVVACGSYVDVSGVISRVNVTVDAKVGSACGVGGLAGVLINSTATNCGSEGNVSGVKNLGGLCYEFYAGTMTGCYNTGAVSGSGTCVGGIMGYAKQAAIKDVYNTGAVSTTKNLVGGLVGEMENSSLTNGYSTGKITVSESGGSSVGAAVGWADTLSNVYYLEGTSEKGVGRDGTAAAKTADELKAKAMPAALGNGFKRDLGNINGGYPVLSWQTSDCKHVWKDGKCETCGIACKHVWKDGKCETCGVACKHVWKDGKCETCGIACKHSGGTATCKDKAVCEVCRQPYGELDKGNHADLKKVDAKKATYTKEGNITYWYCAGCGKYYSDAEATKEITKADTVIPRKTHSSNPGSTGTGSGSDIFQNVKNTINTQDVIYLTYNSPISDELAKVVLSWLRSSPNRVLIVGTDTDATNANLRSYLTADGTWKYYNQSPAVGGKFKRAAQTDGNRRFFTSPFGTVAENAPIARADDYAGYCLNYPAGVTPLVVSDAVGYEKAMIVGVNRQDRIVYHGDANLNQNGRLSSQANANGSVTSDFDRLTANLWAWIVEQVCEQE